MSESPVDREARIEALVEEYLDAIQTGEQPDRAALLAAHPDLTEALDRRLTLVEAMHQLAQSRTAERDNSSRADDRAIRVRCPHCGHPIQLVEPQSHEVTCRNCGTTFPVDSNATAPPPPNLLPHAVGKFQVLGVLGRGTFGTVYKATDPDLARTVAIKVPRAGYFASSEDEERFFREARSAAQLHHLGIVKVLEIGRERGLPYIVSDFIDGPTLADLLTASRPGYLESADLVAQIGDALAYAHEVGIVHRDIKPSNILLDPSGHPHVTDFGLARREEGETVVTLDGQILGTPAYMSPEQAAGDQHRVGPRSDVYSLGVILYVLLTGELPFRGNSRMLIHQVLHDDPKSPRGLDDKVPRDLETICLKAMAKEPTRRYASASEFAADLRRFLNGEPIRARRVGPAERTWRWCRRNPWPCATLLLAAVLTALAIFIPVRMAIERARAAVARAREDTRHRETLMQRIQTLRLITHADGWSNLAWELTREASTIPGDDRLQSQAVGVLNGLDARLNKVFRDSAVALSFDREGKRLIMGGEERLRLWDLATDHIELQDPGASGLISLRADGTPVQLVARPGGLRDTFKFPLHLWNATTRRTERTFANPVEGDSLGCLAWTISPDSSRVGAFVKHRPEEGLLVVWNAESGEVLHKIPSAAADLAFSPDSGLLAAWDQAGQINLWSLPDAKKVAILTAGPDPVRAVAFSRNHWRRGDPTSVIDQWLLAAGGVGGMVTIWDLNLRIPRVICQASSYEVSALAFSPDGLILASAGRGQVSPARRGLDLFDVATGRLLLDLRSRNWTSALAFSPDASKLAAASIRAFGDPGGVDVWTLENGRGLRTLRGLTGPVEKVVVSQDGRLIAGLSQDWRVAIWDRASGQLRRILDAPRGLFVDNSSLAFSPEGNQVAFSAGNQATLWDVATGHKLRSWILPVGLGDALAFPSPDRLLLLRVETRGGKLGPYAASHPREHPRVCRLRGLLSQEPLMPVAEIADFNWFVFNTTASPDGKTFVVEGVGGDPLNLTRSVCAYDAKGTKLWTLHSSKTQGEGSTFGTDPAGKVLYLQQAPSSSRSPCLLLEIASGKLLAEIKPDPVCIGPLGMRFLAYDPDVQMTNDPDDQPRWGISLFERSHARRMVKIPSSASRISGQVVFGPDGRHLAWGNQDGSVTLCDLVEVQRRLADVGLAW